MLCKACRRNIIGHLSTRQLSTPPSILSRPSFRAIATVPTASNAAPVTPPPSTASSKTPAQTSAAISGDSQPFSDSFFPSSSNIATPPASASTSSNASAATSTPSASTPRPLVSSLPGGTSLSALSYVKQPPKPLVALEDHEYPSWLWTLVADPNAPAGSSALDGGLDLSSMSKKTRGKYERKQAKLLANMEKPIPLHEQSRDLTGPGEGADEHAERMRELTRSMRTARRKGIREANFLRSM